MAILRWRSIDALLIYARMNDPERAKWVLKSISQNVDSTVAAHLPHLSTPTRGGLRRSSRPQAISRRRLRRRGVHQRALRRLCEVFND